MKMKTKILVITLILMFFVQGCLFDAMMGDIFGWIPGYGGGSSHNNPSSNDNIITNTIDRIQDLVDDDKDDDSSNLDQNMVDNLEWNCDHIPNSVMNEEGTCVCRPGYGDWYGQCVRLQGSCYSDLDCGNGERSRCSGTDSKITYRCDLVNNRCFPPVTVSCKEEYGSNYICSDGNCVPQIVK